MVNDPVGLVLVWILVAAYLASIFINKKHQSLYDWIAGTYVIVGQPGYRQAPKKPGGKIHNELNPSIRSTG